MILFVGPGGGISWENTQTLLRHNFDYFLRIREGTLFLTDKKTFDSPHMWQTFRCKGRCDRILPIDIADVDHMHPKSQFTWRIIRPIATITGSECFRVVAAHWTILSEGAILCYNYGNAEGKWTSYFITSMLGKDILTLDLSTGVKDYPLQLILENDVTNLQLLCPPCNRSKGATI